MDDLIEMSNQCESASLPKECYADTLINNLRRRKLKAQSDLDCVNAALQALEKNPEVANILELVSKARR